MWRKRNLGILYVGKIKEEKKNQECKPYIGEKKLHSTILIRLDKMEGREGKLGKRKEFKLIGIVGFFSLCLDM